MKRELDPPPHTEGDANSFELLRVWAADSEQHVTIRSDLNGGSERFGFMLVQLMRHGALLYSEREGIPPAVALKQIRDAFDNEWQNPTSAPIGKIAE